MSKFTWLYLQSFETIIFYNLESKKFYERLLNKNFDHKRTSIIPVGFDPKQFVFEKNQLTQPIRLLSVGALTERKQPQKSLKLAYELSKLGVDFHLDFFGSGYLQDELSTITKDLKLTNRVTMHGSVSKEIVSQYYRYGHFLLSMSHSEAFTHTILESWATGTIFVASNTPENLELTQNGKYGLILNPASQAEIRVTAQKIATMTKEEFEQRGEQAFEHSKNFHWERIIEQYSQLIQNPVDSKYN